MNSVSPQPEQLFVCCRWGTDGPGSEAICKRAPTTPERKGVTSKPKLLPTGILYFPTSFSTSDHGCTNIKG